MPMYSAKCDVCNTTHSYVRRIADRNETPVCCGVAMLKVLDTPQLGALSTRCSGGFVAQATDEPTWLESGTDVKRYMKDNSLVTSEEGKERASDAVRNREINLDRALDQAIDKARRIHAM